MFCRWRNWGVVSTRKLVSGAQQTCLDSAELGLSLGLDNDLFFSFLRGCPRGGYGGKCHCPGLLGYAGRLLDPMDAGIFWAAAIAWSAIGDAAFVFGHAAEIGRVLDIGRGRGPVIGFRFRDLDALPFCIAFEDVRIF